VLGHCSRLSSSCTCSNNSLVPLHKRWIISSPTHFNSTRNRAEAKQCHFWVGTNPVLVQSRFAETRFAETLTLTLNPNFGESGFGELGRQPGVARRGPVRLTDIHVPRGVVVPERGGTPFRQIFLSRNGVPLNTVDHSRNADTAAFRQINS